jgi:hypothetical protein
MKLQTCRIYLDQESKVGPFTVVVKVEMFHKQDVLFLYGPLEGGGGGESKCVSGVFNKASSFKTLGSELLRMGGR